MKNKTKNETAAREVVKEPTEAEIAAALTKQYVIIGVSFVQKAVGFGATLALAEMELGRRGLLGFGEGEGMAGWLANHCPLINYKTAMRWKKAADDQARYRLAELSQVDALKLISGEWPEVEKRSGAEAVAKRDAIYAAGSMKQLTAALFPLLGGDEPHAEEAPVEAEAEVKTLTDEESATVLWSETVKELVTQREPLLAATHLINSADAGKWAAELRLLADALESKANAAKTAH